MATLTVRLDPAVAPPRDTALLLRLRTFAARFARDPRHYQMTAQAALYLGGVAWLDFEVPLARAVLTLATTVGTQWACTAVATRLGAKQRFILSQFLLETLIVTAIGGAIGFLISLSICAVFPKLGLGEYVGNPEVSPLVAALTTLALGAVGLVAGYFPARDASRLDPVVAMKL